jgi:hypothetical protein
VRRFLPNLRVTVGCYFRFRATAELLAAITPRMKPCEPSATEETPGRCRISPRFLRATRAELHPR